MAESVVPVTEKREGRGSQAAKRLRKQGKVLDGAAASEGCDEGLPRPGERLVLAGGEHRHGPDRGVAGVAVEVLGPVLVPAGQGGRPGPGAGLPGLVALP